VPASAVIPAPRAYLKIVAVKTPVVELRSVFFYALKKFYVIIRRNIQNFEYKLKIKFLESNLEMEVLAVLGKTCIK